jgi:hypothetical protein
MAIVGRQGSTNREGDERGRMSARACAYITVERGECESTVRTEKDRWIALGNGG